MASIPIPPAAPRLAHGRESIDQDDTLRIQNLDSIEKEDTLEVDNVTQDSSFTVRHRLSPRQVKDVIAGGIIPRLAGEK